jgi:DNA-binding CsgD family transcriptional regulator
MTGLHSFICLTPLAATPHSRANRGSQRSCSGPRTRCERKLAQTSWHSSPPCWPRAEESAVAAVGAARFAAEFEAGKHLDRDTAVALALGKSAHTAVADPGNASTALLGKREAEVAQLVAGGLTNKQIGGRLFISERTVDSHVRTILNKLGFNSRAQIAAWMASPDQ